MARVPRFRLSSVTPDPNSSPGISVSDSPFRHSKSKSTPQAGTAPGGLPSTAASTSTMILTETKQYTVRSLSDTPDQLLRPAIKNHCRVSIEPRSGLAVATTDSEVVVWSYATPGGESNAKSLALPESVGQYPFAAIVPAHQTKGNETGLVLVGRTGGRVVYWDSLDIMHAYGFRKDRHIVEDSITSSYDLDEVVEMVELAGAGGFVIRMRSGKLILLFLRDSRGRVAVKSASLGFDGANGNGSAGGPGGFFSGLKNALFAGPSRNAVAVRTGAGPSKGTGKVVMATNNSFFVWDVDWTGQHRFRGEISLQQLVLSQFADSGSPPPSLELVDVAITSGNGSEMGLILLVKGMVNGLKLHTLIETVLESSKGNGAGLKATVHRVISCLPYGVSERDDDPKLLVVNGSFKTAILVFSNAVSVACLGENPFQDLVLFKDSGRGIIAAAPEDPAANNRLHRGSIQGHTFSRDHVALMLSNGGTLRLTIEETAFHSPASHPTLTAQERFELAAFYGSMSDNPIDFLSSSHLTYETDEIEKAAMMVSGRIVMAGVQGVHSLTNPGIQGKNMGEIVSLLSKSVTGASNILRLASSMHPRLSATARWTLLADRERLEVARQIIRQQIASNDFQIPDFQIPDPRAPGPNTAGHPTGLAELLIPRMSQNMAKIVVTLKNSNPSVLPHIISQSEIADRIFLSLETAFTVRREKAAQYGIDPNYFKEGMLVDGLTDAPQFWTSTPEMINLLHMQVEASRRVIQFVGESALTRPLSPETKAHVRSLSQSHIKLVDLTCRSFVEYIHWAEASTDSETQSNGASFRDSFKQVRSAMIRPLAELGLAGPGMEVAERYRDMSTLSLFLLEKLVQTDVEDAKAKPRLSKQSNVEAMLDEPTGDSDADLQALRDQQDNLREAVQRYFTEFGTQFSDSFFAAHLDASMSHSLVTARFCNFEGGREAIGEYLHRTPDSTSSSSTGLNPIVWIFDALQGQYSSGAEALFQVAKTETSAVARTMNLSIAKVLSCDYQVDPVSGMMLDASQNVGPDYNLDVDLRAARVQEGLNASVGAAAKPVIPMPATTQVATEASLKLFAASLKDSQPAKFASLKRNINTLLRDQSLDLESVLDLLTLLVGNGGVAGVSLTEQGKPSNPFFDDVSRFAAAFAIIEPAIGAGSCGYLPRLVLKRLLLRDDWARLGHDLTNHLASNPMADVDMVSGVAEGVDFSTTFLYKLVLGTPPTASAGADPALSLTGLPLIQLIRRILELSTHEYSQPAFRRRYNLPARSDTSSELLVLRAAGTAPDLMSRFPEPLAIALGAETEAEDRVLESIVAAGGERAVALCLQSAEGLLNANHSDASSFP